jgi:3-phenylpropionate/trans-cinnamate dioxygenase ferredoxin subunit
MDSEWIRVATLDELLPGVLLQVEADGVKVVLAQVDGTVCALKDRCSHADFPLSDGELEGSTLKCQHHGAKFDMCSGRVLQLPAVRPVERFEVRVEDDQVYLRTG